MHVSCVLRSPVSARVITAVFLLAAGTACTEREPPPPPETPAPDVQAAESLPMVPDTLQGDSIMARDTLSVRE
jgi:hypothetical protein